MRQRKLYINQDLIREKIADIEKSVAILEEIALKPQTEFLLDKILLSGAKYQLIMAIEAAQGICNHLAARIAKEAPGSYADCFRILGKNGIISKNLTQKLVAMARFRNILVHQYGKVDDVIVFNMLKRDIGDLITYIDEITAFLKTILEEEQKNETY